MKTYVIAITGIVLLAVACKGKENVDNSKVAGIPASESARKADSLRMVDSLTKIINAVVKADSVGAYVVPEDTPAKQTADSIRLNISFFSPGNGINFKAKQSLDAFVKKYEADNGVTLTIYKSAWGREGEVDYCFKLDMLTKAKQDDFVKQVMDLLKGQDRINYKENTTCRQQRR